MRQLRWILITLVCCLTAQAWAAGAPTVFVSTGTAGKIYSVNTANGSTTLLVSTSGADYEGMVVAPDNSDGTSSRYLVYACDTANSKIIRFDPTGAAPIAAQNIETLSPGGLQHPQCGRVTSTGDLVVTSKDSGSGLWIYQGITQLGLLTAGALTPSALAGSSSPGSSDQGLAQKNIGDLLVVDNAKNQVLRVPAPGFGASSTFITAGLSQPMGIARRSDGDIFVSNQGSSTIVHYNAQGQSPKTCQTFKHNAGIPFFMQMSLDNTLYVALSTASKGSVQSVNATTCAAGASFSIPDPAVGIALPPTTASQNVVASNGSAMVNFGFAAFEINQIAPPPAPCGGTVSVSLLSPAAISELIVHHSGLSVPVPDPVVNLGLDGFEAVISTKNLTGCFAKDGVTLNFQVAHQFSETAANAELMVCDDNNVNCQALFTGLDLTQLGTWPIGGYLPQDGSIGGSKKTTCNIFLVNSNPDTTSPAQAQGTFCGFQSPVNNTFNPNTLLWDLPASSFSAGKSIPVKIKLASAASGNSCQNGSYITGGTALLAVAQVADSKGNTVFVPIGLVSNGSSGLAQPLFKGDNNQQYLFNWDTSSCIMPSGVTQTCPKGTYSMSVEFLTNNTTLPQSIYTVQTTLVTLK